MTRAARVARLLKAVPELMVIGRGIVIVARTVVVIMCLLFMIIYTFDRLHSARQGHRPRKHHLF
jgi:hypothetical protein